jgi:hypothetical protein
VAGCGGKVVPGSFSILVVANDQECERYERLTVISCHHFCHHRWDFLSQVCQSSTAQPDAREQIEQLDVSSGQEAILVPGAGAMRAH